jgi:carbamate kinase
MSPKKQTAVIALGGNAITKKGVPDTIANQFANTRQSLSGIIPLIKAGYNIAITHGNGPQVGNALLRVELSLDKAPELPLGICVADTEGGMGYMIEQSLQNRLRQEKIKRDVVTIVSQVVVDKDDPSMKNPEKYVGQFYEYNLARKYAKERGWKVKKDANRGWRRVVASPMPLEIVEARHIKTLVDKGVIVIAAGGGGIPVHIDENGNYEGVDAVIDKDRASAILAKSIGAELLLILTGIDQVALNFGKLDQIFLGDVSYVEMKTYLDKGHFPPGSMGPKVEAALGFLEMGGRKVIITSIEKAYKAVNGKAGTIITMKK